LYKITTMPDIKIKASKVSSLTDARYFAAAGVDYLGFCCNTGTELYCSPSKIREITEWVQGPSFILELDGWQSEEEIQILLDSQLGQGLHFGAFASYDRVFSLPVFQDFIFENMEEADMSRADYPVIRSDRPFDQLASSEIELLSTICKGSSIFLDIPFQTEDWPELIERIPLYGLIIRGGEEEKTGVKSFDSLDALFDIIFSDR
jgi:phosphoribosylanthranilate isomerase